MFVHDAFDDHDIGTQDIGTHDPGTAEPAPDHDGLDPADEALSLVDVPDPDSGTADGPADPSDDPDPGTTAGPDLVLIGPGGEQIDLGPAEVSSTGETGPIDTVTTLSEDGSSVGVYTDTDGDGTVDQIIDVHQDGSFTLYLQDDDGAWSVGRTGHVDDSGQVVSDPRLDPAAAGSQPAAFGDKEFGDKEFGDKEFGDKEFGDEESGGEPTGPGHPTAPAEGAQITVPGSDGTGFSGAATYDATGDGTNDTVVLHSDDGTVSTATDFDGDGVADQITVVSPDGTVTVAAADQHGAWSTVATGHVTEDGGVVFDGRLGDDDGPPPEHPVPDDHPEDAPDSGPVETANFPGVAAGHLAVSQDGAWVDAGPPQYDMDGDGTPETAVYAAGGSVVQVSDVDGDGRADQMLQIQPDRSATILVDDGTGWQVAAHGALSADGDFVPDGTDPTSGVDTVPASHRTDGGDIALTGPDGTAHQLGAPDQDLDHDGVPESVAARTTDGHLLIVSDADADGRADQVIDVDEQSGRVTWAHQDADGSWVVVQSGHLDSDGNLVVDAPDGPVGVEADGSAGNDRVSVAVDGRSFDAGPATIDTDGDGVADTVAVDGPQGSTLYYQDTDGDGVADRAWTSDASGAVVAEYTLDSASGTWTSTGS